MHLRYTSHSLEQDQLNGVKSPICMMSSDIHLYDIHLCHYHTIIVLLSHIFPVGLPLHYVMTLTKVQMVAIHQYTFCLPLHIQAWAFFFRQPPKEQGKCAAFMSIFVMRLPFPEIHGLSSCIPTSFTVENVHKHNFRII